MIKSIKISGFKNFRGKSVELKELKRINLFVGINGSGKSSILELLMGVSKLSQLNGTGEQAVFVKEQAKRLHSLFEPETSIAFTYDNSPNTYKLKITTQVGNSWLVEKTGSPHGGTEVVAVMRPGAAPFNDIEGDSTQRDQRPFGGIKVFDRDKRINLSHLDVANEILSRVNSAQRQLRKINLSGGQFTFEEEHEIRTEFLSGGSRYVAGLVAAVEEIRNGQPFLIADDLGDELFPAVRKQLLPEINALLGKKQDQQFVQVFATTHNIEIVRSALDHPEYCALYMFDYDGSLIEFDGTKQRIVSSSDGIGSSDSIHAIAAMLGLDDIDLGFPEIVILAEEETKKTFLEAIGQNSSIKDGLRKFEVHVPFQAGDGNTTKAITTCLI